MSSQGPLVVALDQGGHSSRALAFDRSGLCVASARREVGETRPGPDRVEQDPEELVASLRDSLDELCATLGPDAHRIEALGLATQRSSLVCWSARDGRPLSPVLSWQDRRAADRLSALAPHADRVRELTGLFLSPHYGASKFAWCLDELPDVRAARDAGELRTGPLVSFLANRLLREDRVPLDPCNAGRTLLWDLHTLDWSDELLALFGVPRDVLPECTPTRAEFGHVSTPAGDVPLRVLSGDQPAALYADGRPADDTLHVNLGTGAFALRSLRRIEDAPQRLLAAAAFVAGGDRRDVRLVVEGTVNGAASALDHAAQLTGAEDWPARLDDWLAANPAPPLFLNGVSGLGSPYWVPRLESRWLADGDVAARMAGVAESVLFLLQRNLDALVPLEPRATRLRVTGGLTRSSALCARLASLSGLAVEVPVVREATARGTAFWTAGEPATWTELGAPRVFEPVEDAALRDRYARWREALEAAIG